MGLFGGDYIWILPASLRTQWWNAANLPCPKEHILESVEGIIFIGSKRRLEDHERTVSFMVSRLYPLKSIQSVLYENVRVSERLRVRETLAQRPEYLRARNVRRGLVGSAGSETYSGALQGMARRTVPSSELPYRAAEEFDRQFSVYSVQGHIGEEIRWFSSSGEESNF